MPAGLDRARGSGSRSSPGSWPCMRGPSHSTPVLIVGQRSSFDFLRLRATAWCHSTLSVDARVSSSSTSDLQGIARQVPHSGHEPAPYVWTPWPLLPYDTFDAISGFPTMQALRGPRPRVKCDALLDNCASLGYGSNWS